MFARSLRLARPALRANSVAASRTFATIETVHTDAGPAAVGPYSQAVKCGSTAYLSGSIGFIPETMEVIDGGIEAESKQALKNMDAVLAACGAEKTDVIKCLVFLKNMDDFAAFNAIYSEYFDGHKPARSCVAAAELPRGALVEIEAIANLDK